MSLSNTNSSLFWTKEMLKLPTGTLAQVLKLGTKIQRFLTGGKKD